ncbi:MAG: DNA-binding protein [Deltaproteobacteria bacterium]|nr:DNA-binding protein [Deltaproteobacteria bacterium]
MKRNAIVLIAMMSFLILVFAVDSFAQRGMQWRGSGGWGMGSQYGRMYNPKTVETIAGEVVAVEALTPVRGMSYGVHLLLKTDKETVSVHLGPSWYIENQDVKIEPKNKIKVKGSRISFEGKPVIIAAEIIKGNEILKLRNEDGFPVWSGWRRR